MKYRVLSICLILGLVFGVLLPFTVLADDEALGDGMNGGMGMEVATTRGVTIPSSYDGVTPRALASGETLKKGIDVSSYQGTIDWAAVKKSGVEFAIIRAGGRGYSTGALYSDSYFAKNMQGAIANGIQVGVYIFSQAITEEEAREEARYLISMVKKYEIDLPLVMDFEFASSGGSGTGRLYESGLSATEKTAICNAFCAEAEAGGYESMVYANPTMLYNHLKPSSLGRIWLAHYTASTYYTGDYEFWQFSDRGSISGISGNVDLDLWFCPGGSGEAQSPFSDVSKSDWFYESVMTAYEKGIVEGTGDGRFEPQSILTRGQMVTMLYRMAGKPAVSGSVSFKDLTQDYYNTPILWASKQGYVKGYSGDAFGPGDPITRQDFVVILYRMAGSPAVRGSISGFTDTGAIADYAWDAMAWAVDQGLIQGAYGSLNPKSSTNRAEACTLLVRYLALTES